MIALLITAIVLFASEKVRVDLVTLGILVVLTLSGILSPQEAFEGFSNDFMVILASIFIISGALSETGLLDTLGAKMIKLVKSRRLFLSYTMLVTGFLSAFMNNTTVTALVTGPVVGMSRKLSVSPSRILIPVAYASILGGTCTLIGTSTNVAVSGYIAQVGLEPLGFFEFIWIGLLLFGTGILMMLIFWKRLVPDHKEANFIEEYQMKEYLSEILISDHSNLVGQPVFDSALSKRDVRIIKIIRGKEEIIPGRSTFFEAGDLLLVECKVDELLKVKESSGLEILADTISNHSIQSDTIRLAELLILPGSKLLDRSLKEVRFRQNYDLVVLAIQHHEARMTQKIGNQRFQIGDVLLVQGTEEAIEANRNSTDFSVMGAFRLTMFKERKGVLTALMFLAAIILGSLEIIPLSIAFLAASLGVVLMGALTMDRVYELMDWKLLVLIGGMGAFGTAMENSGASAYLASNLINLLGDLGPLWVMAGFVILVMLLTQPMSNAAAALVVLPVALEAADLLQADPRSFAIAIMLGASVSLITPFEPSCILVYGPGKYKFIDFIKAGVPITLILFILILILVPFFWPL